MSNYYTFALVTQHKILILKKETNSISKMSFVKNIVTLILLFVCFTISAQKATYIANSGVFVRVGEYKIMIDAFFEDGRGRFFVPDQDQLQSMIAGKPPYNNLKVALVTHNHPENVSAEKINELMTAQKKIDCIVTPQAIADMKTTTENFESLASRAVTYPLSSSWKIYNKNGVEVRSAYSKHGGKANAKVQNFIFLITMGGKKILHLGDADMDLARFQELKLHKEGIDIAFVPFWYTTGIYGSEIVKKYINAKKVVAVHFPIAGSTQSLKKTESFVPGTIVFTTPGQSVSF